MSKPLNVILGLFAYAMMANAWASPPALGYVARCALPEGSRLTDEAHGLFGLAPNWMDHVPTPDEQRWVSACLLALVNAFGKHVQVSLRGPHPSLSSTLSEHEKANFTVAEGAFFGNILGPTHQAYACSAISADLAHARARVCTIAASGSVSSCGFTIVGACESVCKSQSTEGYWEECEANGTVWTEVVSVYLEM